jgi:hypothetical protein
MAVSIQRPTVPELPPVWKLAPGERSHDYFATFSAISVAIQRCLRERVAALFLADPAIFEHPKLVYPMLMYAASRPFRPRSLHEFSYDPMDVSWFLRFVRASKRGLAPQLREVYDRLDREQMSACRRAYGPRRVALAIRTVRRFKRSQTLLSGLVAGEAALVGDLLRLAGLGGLSERDRKRRQARFFRNLQRHLRQMCLRCDLTPLAPVLLAVATQELTSALQVQLAA